MTDWGLNIKNKTITDNKMATDSLEEKIKIIELEEVDSTNRFLREYDGEEGQLMTVAVAHSQTAGRGQGTNTWESEPGKNLTFSVRIRPRGVPASSQYILLEAMALAIRSTLDTLVSSVRSWQMLEEHDFMAGRLVASGTDCRGFTIKWPNDIYWDDRKISGTLSECEVSSRGVGSCILGSGININQMQFISDAPNPVSLAQIMGRSVSLKKVLRGVLQAFAAQLERIGEGDFAAIEREYMDCLYRRTGEYRYADAQGEFFARIEKVLPNGHLILRRDGGELREYAFKEVAFL